MSASIGFHSLVEGFSLKGKKNMRVWLDKVIAAHHHYSGEISFIYCSDNYLLEMNNQYLSHNIFTDIITFNYNQGQQISGDIFISVDRVHDNCIDLQISFEQELARVMVHGVLHLLGYGDKTQDEKANMRAAEDKYLSWQETPLNVSRETN